MDDLQTSKSKKARRRSLRNIRRSSNFMPTVSVSYLEPNVLEDGNKGDVSTIIHSYGSAWLGDENVDPLVELNKPLVLEQNLSPTFHSDEIVKTGKSDGDWSPVLCLPANEQVQSRLDKPVVEERSLADSVLHSNYDKNGGIEKHRSCVSPVSVERHGSISSVSDSLPDLDLSLYGSVEDWLNPCSKSRGAFDSPNMAPSTKDYLNEAFMDNFQGILKTAEEIESGNVVNNLKFDSPVSKVDEVCLPSPVSDVEMQPCEREACESSSASSPKFRKVAPRNETDSRIVSPDVPCKSPGNYTSVNKTSSVLGMTMLSAIQSLTSRLEALSSISEAERGSNSKPFSSSSKNIPLKSQVISVSTITKSDSEANKGFCKGTSEIMDPVISEKTNVGHSCTSDIAQSLIQDDKDTKTVVQEVSRRKRLSLNRRTSSDNTEVVNSSPPKSAESLAEKNETSESKVAANEEYHYENKLEECNPGYDSQPSISFTNSMVENGKTSTAKEYDSDIAQAMLSNTSLEEESVLLEELSLRFSDDIAQPKILKSRRSAGSSRRKSTRWQNPPCSDLTCPEQIVPQDFRVDTGDQQMCFDGTCKVDLPLRESLESSVDSLLFNTHTNNTFQGDQCETKETACNKINVELEENEYREQAQCEESSSEVCKTKSKRKERRSGKFVPVNYGGNPETSSLETLSGEGSNVMSHSNHIGGDAVTDQLMEDLTVLTNVSDAGDKLVHSLAEATDLSNVANSYEESDLNDSCIGIRQSTRSQRTCKRKSWVLPTANDGSSSLTEKQKRGGRKDVNNKTVSETASSDTAKQDTTLTNTQDEFMVDEALRLLYLNKVYKAPPSMRSWETIKESPTNSKNVFIGKRRLRMLTFEEGLTHTRMVRRHRRATIVNELSQNKVVPISQEEFQCKMKSLSSLLDS